MSIRLRKYRISSVVLPYIFYLSYNYEFFFTLPWQENIYYKQNFVSPPPPQKTVYPIWTYWFFRYITIIVFQGLPYFNILWKNLFSRIFWKTQIVLECLGPKHFGWLTKSISSNLIWYKKNGISEKCIVNRQSKKETKLHRWTKCIIADRKRSNCITNIHKGIYNRIKFIESFVY